MLNDPHERKYTIKEAARTFCHSKNEIMAAIRSGELEALSVAHGAGRYGFKYMIPESAMRKWERRNDPVVEEEPLVIKGFTSIADIFKEGETMTAEEMQNKLDNAVYEEPQTEDFSKGWLTVRDIAERVPCQKSVVKKHIDKGILKATKRYGKLPGPHEFMFMVKEEDYEEWIKNAGKNVGKRKVKRRKNKEEEPIVENTKPEVAQKEQIAELNRSDLDAVLELVKDVLNEACDKAYQDGYSAGRIAGREQAKKEFEGLENKLRGILDAWGN